MHRSSYLRMEYLVRYYERYFKKDKETVKVLDIGSYDVNGTYKDIFCDFCYHYTGMDMAEGSNVDIVPADIYSWKEIADESFDLIISGQVFEHVEYPWLTVREIERVLKPGGFCMIIVPGSGMEHKAPKDCRRYYADGLVSLAKWAGLKVHHTSVGGVPKTEEPWDWVSEWNDGCLVAQKEPAAVNMAGEPFEKEIRVPMDDVVFYGMWKEAVQSACERFSAEKPFVLFGAGWIGDMALEILGSGKVEYYVDNDKSKTGRERRGKRVRSFDEYLNEKDKYNCLITVSYHAALEICKQLSNSGAAGEIVYPRNRIKETDKILSCLEDEESRFIYQKRAEYNESGEFSAIKAIADRYLPQLKDRPYYPGIEKKMLERLVGRNRIVLFGSGLNGRICREILKEHDTEGLCFADNNSSKWGNTIDGLEVKDPQKIDYDEIDAVVITPYEQVFADAIHRQLLDLGVSEDALIYYRDYCPSMLEYEQYFDPDIIKLQENEVFVDAGVLNLGTSLRFIEECGKKKIKKFKIYAFEPDGASYTRCQEIRKTIPDVDLQLYHAGLWREETTLHFTEMGNGASRITQQETETSIKVVSLDHCISGPITFIKMDIEGAELKALKGCQETIRKYRPKLAISIYHKKEDLVEIPLFIKELVPEYRLYIRHYSNDTGETVLYAVY